MGKLEYRILRQHCLRDKTGRPRRAVSFCKIRMSKKLSIYRRGLRVNQMGCNISTNIYCSFLILFIWVLSFSWLSWLEAYFVCPLLFSSIFSIIVLVSVLFISSLIFIISFLLMTLGFVYSFLSLVLLGGRVGYLRFYLLLEKGPYHGFPSLNYFCCVL